LANHKSALKRARQNEIRRLRNKSTKTRLKHLVKEVRSTADESSAQDASQKCIVAQSALDKAVKKGVIHRKTASRKISRLTRKIQTSKKT
jgi:small subunit ribosomal protein S20